MSFRTESPTISVVVRTEIISERFQSFSYRKLAFVIANVALLALTAVASYFLISNGTYAGKLFGYAFAGASGLSLAVGAGIYAEDYLKRGRIFSEESSKTCLGFQAAVLFWSSVITTIAYRVTAPRQITVIVHTA